jgi:mediator of RNA polymerase II transcription subunit 8
MLQTDPLPSWYGRVPKYESIADRLRTSLQSTAAIISQNLASVSQQLSTHHDLFASMSAYPTHEFPGMTQESVLNQLLRKKLEPNVEDWVNEGRSIATQANEGPNRPFDQSELENLWSWAPAAANERARTHKWFGNYTLEEKEMGIENVVTGLKRKLKEDPDDSSDEDEEEEAIQDGGDPNEMEIVGVHRKSTGQGLEFDITTNPARTELLGNARPALSIDDTFRFLMTGIPPLNR